VAIPAVGARPAVAARRVVVRHDSLRSRERPAIRPCTTTKAALGPARAAATIARTRPAAPRAATIARTRPAAPRAATVGWTRAAASRAATVGWTRAAASRAATVGWTRSSMVTAVRAATRTRPGTVTVPVRFPHGAVQSLSHPYANCGSRHDGVRSRSLRQGNLDDGRRGRHRGNPHDVIARRKACGWTGPITAPGAVS
jgi:hypothetical protein